ncbi:MAG: hypothetical protein ABSF26_10785 [Thermoguttaceae bacterium]|jgi:hypothetical protein
MAKRTRRGQKQCPKCQAWIKGTRTKTCSQCGHQFNGNQKQAPAPEPAAAPAEKKAGDTVTISQVKAVVQTAKAVGGFDRLSDLLGLIREIGGMKKFKDLLEAMTAA